MTRRRPAQSVISVVCESEAAPEKSQAERGTDNGTDYGLHFRPPIKEQADSNLKGDISGGCVCPAHLVGFHVQGSGPSGHGRKQTHREP